MQRVDIKGDVRHAAPVNVARDLIKTLEVPLKHQLPAAGDQYSMNIGPRSHEPVSHPAQRGSVNELVVIDGDDRPAIVSPAWNAAALGWVRVHWEPGE